ncbi:MAG TPA: FtsX-like permease family protein [Thermoanaerobaculia bacterium]
MTPLLRRAGLRHLARHPWQAGLSVLGVALGVAVVVAIDLANASAQRAFTLSTEAVVGRATHQVTGGPGGLPEAAYRRLVLAAGVDDAAPVVEDWVTVERPAVAGAQDAAGKAALDPPRVLHLLGVDPFAEAPFRPYLAPGAAGTDVAAFLTRPGAAVLAAGTAHELGVAQGGSVTILAAGHRRRVELVGVLEPEDATAGRALADLLLVDVATAQELLGRVGRLDRIDLRLPDGTAGAALLARVRRALPPGASVVPAAARAARTEEMTRAFRVNLTALSLLALICGVFLIYNAMTFSVVQRRALLGTLRALGVTRGEVFALVLSEALLVGLVGSLLGLAAGVLLGRGLVGLVTQTINDLYFVLAVRELAVPPAVLVKGAVLGTAATLVAALAPAREATAAPPRAVLIRSSLESAARRALPRAAALGFALLALGALLLALPGTLLLSFAGLFGLFLGAALLTPGATVLLMHLLRPAAGALFGLLGRMAAGGVVAALSRTGVAVAALVVAVSVAVGVGTMIDSFRGTVRRWLDASLGADLYVGAAGRPGTPLDPALAARAAALPGVERVDAIRQAEVPSERGRLRVLAVDVGARGRRSFELRQGRPAEAWRAVAAGRGVLISEPLASRWHLGVGSRLKVSSPVGERTLVVAGVFYDYASEQGTALMTLPHYRRLWGDPLLSGFSLHLAPGADAAAVERGLRRTAGADRPLAINPNRELKRRSLEIFDRTFRITAVLRLLAGLVAFIGVLSALMALQLERARELAVLRANGLTRGQLWRLVTAQTGLLGLAAGLLSLPLGLALAAVMVHVVNRRSFGWTVRLDLAPEVFLQPLALTLGAALLAGLYPAWRMARTPPAEALREE